MYVYYAINLCNRLLCSWFSGWCHLVNSGWRWVSRPIPSSDLQSFQFLCKENTGCSAGRGTMVSSCSLPSFWGSGFLPSWENPSSFETSISRLKQCLAFYSLCFQLVLHSCRHQVWPSLGSAQNCAKAIWKFYHLKCIILFVGWVMPLLSVYILYVTVTHWALVLIGWKGVPVTKEETGSWIGLGPLILHPLTIP